MDSPPRTRGKKPSTSKIPVNQQQQQSGVDNSSANLPEDDASKKKNAEFLPFKAGNQLLCRWRDGIYYPVKIIARRKLVDGGVDDFEYYVHYIQFNSRLDEWVRLEQLDLDSLKTNIAEEGHEELDAALLYEHEKVTKVKNIETIELGSYKIETWYFSPCPAEYNDCRELFFCEFCLTFFKHKSQLQRHKKKCDSRQPPGNEIYRDGTLSIYEASFHALLHTPNMLKQVDPKKNWVYSENLWILAKLFLENKAPLKDINRFLFYVLCECDDSGCHMVAYFSKRKDPEGIYNLSYILTLPPYQRRGYGAFLIAFSYELSKKEGKAAGAPERPLSDLGRRCYERYWTWVLLNILKQRRDDFSIQELSQMTAIHIGDIAKTLQDLELIQSTKELQTRHCMDTETLDRLLRDAAGPPGGLKFDVTKLDWTPYKQEQS
ncbi:MOZ/SAS-like protein [Macleaya cordata]|uniref:Histone acetyltransferase n=1 Tax=Macleaya cordata TaxID=56857 RepID=A0A200QT92_MACCD|nr:MOZ/SAS-like protein [Macleaya cordata]